MSEIVDEQTSDLGHTCPNFEVSEIVDEEISDLGHTCPNFEHLCNVTRQWMSQD